MQTNLYVPPYYHHHALLLALLVPVKRKAIGFIPTPSINNTYEFLKTEGKGELTI